MTLGLCECPNRQSGNLGKSHRVVSTEAFVFGRHLPCAVGETPWRIDENSPKRCSIRIKAGHYLAVRRNRSHVFVHSGHKSFHLYACLAELAGHLLSLRLTLCIHHRYMATSLGQGMADELAQPAIPTRDDCHSPL
jgi:hypothetical protein